MQPATGADALRTICQREPEVQFIVLSCCHEEASLQAELGSEPVRYILQDVPSEQLANRLRELRARTGEGGRSFGARATGEDSEKPAAGSRTVVVLRVQD